MVAELEAAAAAEARERRDHALVERRGRHRDLERRARRVLALDGAVVQRMRRVVRSARATRRRGCRGRRRSGRRRAARPSPGSRRCADRAPRSTPSWSPSARSAVSCRSRSMVSIRLSPGTSGICSSTRSGGRARRPRPAGRRRSPRSSSSHDRSRPALPTRSPGAVPRGAVGQLALAHLADVAEHVRRERAVRIVALGRDLEGDARQLELVRLERDDVVPLDVAADDDALVRRPLRRRVDRLSRSSRAATRGDGSGWRGPRGLPRASSGTNTTSNDGRLSIRISPLRS